MTFKGKLDSLLPEGYGSLEQEPFDRYFDRVKDQLPDWPQSVVEQWIYHHYQDWVGEYSWLLTDVSCSFKLLELSTDQIITDVDSHKMDHAVDRLGRHITTTRPSMRSWLMNYMLSEGTWATPIIVFDNRSSLTGPRGEKYGIPLHLLEGHLRLGYLREMSKTGHALLPSHEIWLTEIQF